MVKTKITCLCLSLLCAISNFAQNETDYYRFVDTRLQATARVQGMGGSFGALGADLSSATINPAGLGRYSNNYFGLSLNQESIGSTSNFRDNSKKSNDFNLKVGSFGGVFTKDVSRRKNGWNYRQVTLGYNKIASYESKMKYEGQQYESLLEVFANQAAGTDPIDLEKFFPFTTSLAYETYALDYNAATKEYIPLLTAGEQLHKRSVEQNGGSGEWYFGVSGNYSNKFFIGATLNLRRVNYNSITTHEETLLDTAGVDLRSFEFTENLGQKGSSTSLRVGGIYVLTKNFNIGLSAVTPSFLKITDKYSTNFSTTFESSVKTPPADLIFDNTVQYRITMPLRVTGSLAYINPRFGSINMDVEYTDYSSAKFIGLLSNNYSYNPENKRIREDFNNGGLNVRLGGEYVYDSEYLLRAGFNYNGNILNSGVAGPGVSNGFSLGFGIRKEKVKFDVSYSYLGGRYPYSAFLESKATVKYNRHVVSIGIGF